MFEKIRTELISKVLWGFFVQKGVCFREIQLPPAQLKIRHNLDVRSKKNET